MRIKILVKFIGMLAFFISGFSFAVSATQSESFASKYIKQFEEKLKSNEMCFYVNSYFGFCYDPSFLQSDCAFLATCAIVSYKINLIFDILKEDEEIKRYFEQLSKLSRLGFEETEEEHLKGSFIDFVLSIRNIEWAKVYWSESTRNKNAFVSSYFSIPERIFRKINDQFKNNKKIRKIVEDNSFIKDDYSKIKDHAVKVANKYLEKAKKEFDVRTATSHEEKIEYARKSKLENMAERNDKFWYANINLFKKYLEMKKQRLKLLLEDVKDEKTELEIKKEISRLESLSEEEILKDFEVGHKGFLEYVSFIENNEEVKLTQDEIDWIGVCDAGVERSYNEDVKNVGHNIEIIKNLSQADFEKVCQNIKIGVEKNNQFFEGFLQVGFMGLLDMKYVF